MKVTKRVVLAISSIASALLFVEACYLTSDFSGIADGTRPPAEGGGADSDTVDAGTTPSDAGEAGAFTCANTPYAVCTTFDDMGALASGGWKVQMLGSGQASLDQSQFVTAPNSFRSLVPGNSTTQHWSAIIFQPVVVPTTYTTLTYAFDFRLTTCTANGSGMTVVAINPNPQHTLGMLITKSGLEWGEAVIDDGGSVFMPATLTKQPASGVWIRITMIIKNPSNPTVDVLYDDKPVLSAHPFTPFTPAGTVLLNLGNNGSGPNTNCDIAYDNVIFDRQ
jgi:hypothetical protein